eukprot:6187742-Pleurochrysis_carterae.AAC.2
MPTVVAFGAAAAYTRKMFTESRQKIPGVALANKCIFTESKQRQLSSDAAIHSRKPRYAEVYFMLEMEDLDNMLLRLSHKRKRAGMHQKRRRAARSLMSAPWLC